MFWWQEPEKRRAAEQFEREYAARSDASVESMHSYGRFAEPCDCDYELCEGWGMVSQWEEALFDEWVREGRPPVRVAGSLSR